MSARQGSGTTRAPARRSAAVYRLLVSSTGRQSPLLIKPMVTDFLIITNTPDNKNENLSTGRLSYGPKCPLRRTFIERKI